jgi:hypothetical protein
MIFKWQKDKIEINKLYEIKLTAGILLAEMVYQFYE